MKKEYVVALILLLVISNIITLGLVWNHLRSEPKTVASQPPMMPAYRLQASLNLTDQQTGAYNRVKAKYIQSSQPLADSLWTERNRLMDALSNTNSDTAHLRTIEANISRLQQQLLRQSVDQYFAIKKILKPNQQEALTDVYYSLFGCGRHGMGMRVGNRQCGMNGE
jgi:Spy/CpxP family protein refolding chaperone